LKRRRKHKQLNNRQRANKSEVRTLLAVPVCAGSWYFEYVFLL